MVQGERWWNAMHLMTHNFKHTNTHMTVLLWLGWHYHTTSYHVHIGLQIYIHFNFRQKINSTESHTYCIYRILTSLITKYFFFLHQSTYRAIQMKPSLDVFNLTLLPVLRWNDVHEISIYCSFNQTGYTAQKSDEVTCKTLLLLAQIKTGCKLKTRRQTPNHGYHTYFFMLFYHAVFRRAT